MTYQAIARKYRPEVFADVVGQAHVTETLRAALRKDKLSHAYLFSGPRGCGKTTVARLLAKAINCRTNREGDPCGTCETCLGIAQGNYLDVLEIDAASNTGVDNVRELRDMAQYAPSEGSSRVFIIDEVHMLSKGAFNALLKILEEPPARVYFFFATTEANKIPRTILSRCQRFDFRLLNRDELGARLEKVASAEGATLEPTGQRLLVSLAEGSMRDGLSLLDQVIAGVEGDIDEAAVVAAFGLVRSELYIELNKAIIAADAAAALRLVEDLASGGQSLDEFARGVVTNFRNLMLLKIDANLADMVDLPPDQVQQLQQQAERFSQQDLLALIDRAGRHFERIHRSTQPRIMLEAAVVEYCRFESRVLLSDLARRLGGLAAGAPAGGSANPAGGGTGGTSRGPDRPAPDRNPAGGGSVGHGAAGADSLSGWTQLIDVLMQTAPRVAACLMEGLPALDAETGRLTIAFAQDKAFHVSSIESECDRVSEVASRIWNRPVKVELVLGEAGQSEQTREEIRQEVAPTMREELDKACGDDPMLDQLVDSMGADPLPESEKDKWLGPDRSKRSE